MCIDARAYWFSNQNSPQSSTPVSLLGHVEAATISDNNIGQWLPFPPYPLPNVVLQVQKNIERKVDIIVATLKEGSGEGLSSEGGQRLLAEIVFLIYARNFDGPFSSLSRDRFSKRHN